jgi:hypothetical protein
MSEPATLIVQVRDRASLDLVVTTDDLTVVTAVVNAIQARLGLHTKAPLRVVRKPPEAPDGAGGR